jgi:hypothetical protein
MALERANKTERRYFGITQHLTFLDLFAEDKFDLCHFNTKVGEDDEAM